MNLIFIIHLFSCLFMTGLCWFAQIVHYPLFRQIKLEDFPIYEKKNFVTGFVTVPVMTLEMITALILLYNDFNTLLIINVLLFGIIGISTFVFQVPIHLALTKNASEKLISKLIKTNWIRTISWSLRSILLGYVLLEMLKLL